MQDALRARTVSTSCHAVCTDHLQVALNATFISGETFEYDSKPAAKQPPAKATVPPTWLAWPWMENKACSALNYQVRRYNSLTTFQLS